MGAESFLHSEENRGDVYRLLSKCYYLPGEHTAAQVAELTNALESAYPEVADLAMSMTGEIDIKQLQIDFSKLFVGPFKLLAPPYGSVYLETGRRVMGDSTIDARNRYRESGLDFSDDIKEAPDHIAIELEFMYYLIFKEIEAMANSDRDSALALLNKQRAFLVDHIAAWISNFTALVEENAATDFYKNLARATRVFVLKDKAEISKMSFTEQVTQHEAD